MSSSFTIILCVSVILFSGFSLSYAENENHNEEALFEASKNGNEEIVKELLRNGTNVNAIAAEDKSTALIYATENNREKIVEILLEYGANVNVVKKFRETAMYHAIRNGNQKIVELLIKNGVDINAEFGYKSTALKSAVSKNFLNIVEILLKNGADVNAGNGKTSTPLHLAVNEGSDALVMLLLKNGAYVNAGDRTTGTPLNVAAERDNDRLAEILLKNGANIEATSSGDRTALISASVYDNAKIVEFLIKNGAKINAGDNNKRTALHWAASTGSKKAANVLIELGADIEAQDIFMIRPLHLAVINDYHQIVEALLQKGASRDAKNDDDETPLDIAKRKGYPKIIRLLMNIPRPAVEACQKYQNLPSGYILGGTPVELGELPWMAALGYYDFESGYGITFDCGGTIISDRYVLTAAHCASPSHAPVVVRLGKTTLNDTDDIRPVNIQIKNITRHSDYSTLTKKNDIALLRLKEKIGFTDFISPACLQTDLRDENLEADLIVAGWGKTSAEQRDRSNTLLKAILKTIPVEECSEQFLLYNLLVDLPAFREGIHASQYCAYDPKGTADSCQGDSGGPLQILNKPDAVATIVGIVSFGISCGSNLPGIYTRVAYYLDWIESIVWPDNKIVEARLIK